jgi:hypothetical protein
MKSTGESHMNVEPNVKRSKNLITWSCIYLATSWLVVVSGFLNSDPNKFVITDLLVIVLIPVSIVTFVVNFRWVRSLIITARQIQPEGIGYRQGWAFWSWVTPIAAFFIPRRLITRPFESFAGFTGRSNILATNLWWGFFIASGVMDNLSFRAGLGTSELVPFFDLLSAIFLTIAFPQWKVIIETVTSAQAASVEQLLSSHLSSNPQE